MTKKNGLPESSRKAPKEERRQPGDLPGWPGYRTRYDRSGYDPIDTRTEAAHVSGTFIQNLFAGKLKIRNPIALFLSGLLGLLLILPLFVAILELLHGNVFPLEAGLMILIAGVIGIALLTNVIKNLRRQV